MKQATTPAALIAETKRQFVAIIIADYLLSGFFWFFSSAGSIAIGGHAEPSDKLDSFFLSMFVLMISNGLWEVLTGWYADKFQRRLSIVAGFGACFFGFALMVCAAYWPTFPSFFQEITHLSPLWLIGITVWSLGPALLSGAEEAWFVDRCNFYSTAPPEDLDKEFYTSNALGTIAKAAGILCCLVIFSLLDPQTDTQLVFLLSGGVAALVAAALTVYCIQLEEEYWAHPKYQTDETLVAFLVASSRELVQKPYRWFTAAFVGVTAMNYLLSSTLWPYLVEATSDKGVRAAFFGMEALGGLLGLLLVGPALRRVWTPNKRLLIACVIFAAPALGMLVANAIWSISFFAVLGVATISMRLMHGSVSGALNTLGQKLIAPDEKRAVLLSMSSSLASFAMAIPFFLLRRYGAEHLPQDGLAELWRWVALPSILLVAFGATKIYRARPLE